ncbi:MAG: phosphatase [Legionella sp.]|nr:phosphatase [Legionella sp.]
MRILLTFFLCICGYLHADTINNYMNIANNIPQMEIKADPQAQAWARSARHVLTITCESIAETLTQANETAKIQGKPIFCLPAGTQLNSITLNELIQQTYKEISSQRSDKDTMTVSQVALLGVSKKYPCQNTGGTPGLMHVGMN